MRKQRLIFLCLSLLALWGVTREESAMPADAQAEIPKIKAEIPETKYVALTFDDGPRADTTGGLLDGLLERGASATFFLIGEQIEANRELVLRMRAEGHQVGNHTWSHAELRKLDKTQALEEVSRTDALLQEILGPGTYWIRPPYGLLREEQYTWFSAPLVHWSLDPEDWKLRNTQADVRAILKKVQPGDIILMHDSVPASVDAALQVIDTLQPQGYVFVTVEELLALNGVEPPVGRMIRSATDTWE